MSSTSPDIKAALEQAVLAVTPSQKRWRGSFRKLGPGEDIMTMSTPSGLERAFMVAYGDGREGPYQGFADAETIRTFFVRVLYPAQRNDFDLADVTEYDLHDLRVALNNFQNWSAFLTTPTDLLHAFVAEFSARGDRTQDRFVMTVPVEVQFLEAVV